MNESLMRSSMMGSLEHQNRLCSFYFENPVASYSSCIQWQDKHHELDVHYQLHDQHLEAHAREHPYQANQVRGLNGHFIEASNRNAICPRQRGGVQFEKVVGQRSAERIWAIGKGTPNSRTKDCDNFTVDDNSIDYKMRYIGDQLAHLVRDIHNIDSSNDSGHYSSASMLANSTEFVKMRRILRLYEKMLAISPLDFRLNMKSSTSSYSQIVATNLDATRQQVLLYIENLHGYCDSINMLRLIMKSSNMICVIGAYEAIAIKWLAWDRVVNGKPPNVEVMSAIEWSV